MQKILIESTATVTGSKISGVALTPTTSRNGNNYLPDVIDSAKGVNTWLENFNWEHTDEKIGPVRFTVDPKTHTMYYEAVNTSNRKIKEGTHKVSIEAHVDEVARTCSPKTCYNTPMSLTMEGLAVTENPSVQTTTLTIIESADQLNKICEEIIIKHEDVNIDGSAGQPDVDDDHKFKPSKSDPNICEVCGKPESDHQMAKESEQIKKLENKIAELESKLNKSITCSKCGGIKKH